MRRIKVLAVIASIAFLAACGGSGSSGGNADEQAEEAAETFFTIIESCGILNVGAELDMGISAKDLSKQITQCACPGGGQIDINEDQDTVVLTVTSCKAADGENFDGNITIDVASGQASVDMDDFGDECSTVEAPNLSIDEGNCGGTLTATCSAGTASCTLVEPQVQGDGCDAQCT